MLLVRGPNVMTGYVNGDSLTRKVMINGWYATGDFATVDADGFLRIRRQLPSAAHVENPVL
jgi:acyl-[acyl-carrier-protein]-phospholipid O-acyltransferase / long-chain-fatty-acid--[acyl-carrier-protein] ligase